MFSIFIGDYVIFWDKYYESFVKNFYPEFTRNLVVFTDSEKLLSSRYDYVDFVKVENEGWPNNSMNRFYFFNTVIDKYKNYDFIFFFQSNAIFLKKLDIAINDDFEKGVIFRHPLANQLPACKRPYDRNKKSSAYIAHSQEPDYYYQAAAFGAPKLIFRKLINTIIGYQKINEKNNIVPIWHDESYLNKYIFNFQSEFLSYDYSYIYPEGLSLEKTPVVLLRDKSRFFNVQKLKKGSRLNTYFGKIKINIKCLFLNIFKSNK